MASLMSSTPLSLDPTHVARMAFDELDWQQLAIFARHSPTRRIQIMFDLCRFAQRMIIASERQRHPDITDEELAQRVRERIQLTYGA